MLLPTQAAAAASPPCVTSAPQDPDIVKVVLLLTGSVEGMKAQTVEYLSEFRLRGACWGVSVWLLGGARERYGLASSAHEGATAAATLHCQPWLQRPPPLNAPSVRRDLPAVPIFVGCRPGSRVRGGCCRCWLGGREGQVTPRPDLRGPHRRCCPGRQPVCPPSMYLSPPACQAFMARSPSLEECEVQLKRIMAVEQVGGRGRKAVVQAAVEGGGRGRGTRAGAPP